MVLWSFTGLRISSYVGQSPFWEANSCSPKKKFTFRGSRRFISVFTKRSHLVFLQSQMNTPDVVRIHFVTNVHLSLYLSGDLFPSYIHTNILPAVVFCALRTTFPPSQPWFELLKELCRIQIMNLLVRFSGHSRRLEVHTFPSALCSQTPSVFSSLNAYFDL